MIAPQVRLREVMGREKRETPAEETETSAALRVAVLDARARAFDIYDERIQSKSERGRRMAELKEKIASDLAASDAVPGHTAEQLDAAYLHASSRVMRVDLRRASSRGRPRARGAQGSGRGSGGDARGARFVSVRTREHAGAVDGDDRVAQRRAAAGRAGGTGE